MECLSMRWITVGASWSGPERAQLVPCGKCAFCLQNKRSQWMFRLYHEMKNQELPGYFLTMTYNEKCVPRRDFELSLRFRDVQLYLKRIRKAKYKCKYVAVGEYGTRTERPHYHMMLWTDCPVDFLQKNWKHSKSGISLGAIHFGTLNMKSAMYSMKYIIQAKRHYGRREKPRAQFSKGLGISFLSIAQYDYLTRDYENPVFISKIDGMTVAIPRYYKSKIFTRYQLRVESNRIQQEKKEEKEKLHDELRAQGVREPEAYIASLRIVQAARIMDKQKINEKL